jgi:5-methylcytosine-specific restriction endonuclease McrA
MNFDPRSHPPRSALTAARHDASHLADLLRQEHGAMADFLVALAEFDRRRGWAELGHASLWHFLHKQLGLSRSAAFQRKAAAELLERHPAVEVALRDGRLCLSSVHELGKVLTHQNQAEVLPRFFHLAVREAREVVVELAPRPVVPTRTVVTAAPRQGEGVLTSGLSEAGAGRNGTTSAPAPTSTPTSTAAQHPPATEVPLTATLTRLHLTVSRGFLAKLTSARSARGHARRGATAEAILEEALDLLLAREPKRREAKADRPLGTPRPSAPGHVPAEVRREVWARDAGRCQWPLDGGGICGSTHRPELDHAWPRARGGPPTVANLRILCEAHNKEAARRAFGAPWMARFRTGTKPPAGETPDPPPVPGEAS